MIDCTNAEIRDLLPDFLHHTLQESEYQRVSEHLRACSLCTEELALLRTVLEASKPVPVNVAAVAAAVHPYRKQRFTSAAPFMRAAAVIAVVAVGATSFSVITRTQRGLGSPGGETVAVWANDSSPRVGTSTTPASAADVSSLDEQALAELLAEMKSVDVSLSEEPRKLMRNPGSGDDE